MRIRLFKRVSIPFVLLLAASPVVSGQNGHRWPTPFEGPIHTQLLKSKPLNKDPRKRERYPLNTSFAWMVFCPTGERLESGSLDDFGKPVNLVRPKHDESGRETEVVAHEGDKTSIRRTEREIGPFGTTEERVFVDNKLWYRIVSTSSREGNEIDCKHFDESGQLIFHSIEKKDKFTKDLEIWGAQGKWSFHSMERYDENGEVIESSRFNSEGSLVSEFSFNQGHLTSHWQDPQCHCTNVGAFGFPGEYTVYYTTDEDGTFLEQVRHHKGQPTGRDPDDVETRDVNGKLVEWLTFTYERDKYGNWTKRLVSVRDVESGLMIPVQEDTRILTYY
ncbi:MAG TPA: hypothetical protein VHA33_18950 [Candidatus Angelobacter sp.]|jgi:hypothetical protein|nr:hypothetical protein [Candidatus Angelobacter sp.]